MIAIACDHAGIDLKPHVIAVLDELGIPYKDFGTNSHESVDYPIYGARAANAVASGECDRGIVCCTTGIGVSHGRGVILLAICKSGAPLFEYTPNQVKQAVVGYGGADKHQVMEMTRRILKMEKVARPDDAADAIAIALCHARSSTSLLAQKGYR